MKLTRLLIAVTLCSGLSIQAQDTGTTAAPAPAPAAAPTGRNWTYGGVQVSGLVDAYYSLNFNHPATDRTDLHFFDVYANRVDLNMAKIGLDYGPNPVGFHLDAGFGEGFNAFHSFDPNRDLSGFHHILQAYVSWKPKSGHGLEIDGGKFYTSAGAEVTESQLNWNYSRSLLFALGPFYHVGVRASMPITKSFTGGIQFVNGWNDLVDNNTGKTLGLNGTWTVGKVAWANSYYAGPEKTDTNQGWRHFYDTVVTINASKTVTSYVNFDYGADRNIGGGASVFYGIATATRVTVGSKFAFSPRIEWYNDRDGFATGTPQKLKEFTFTGEYKIHDGIVSRLEFRRDWSDQPFFHRGNDEFAKNQTTVLLGLMAFFGPKQ